MDRQFLSLLRKVVLLAVVLATLASCGGAPVAIVPTAAPTPLPSPVPSPVPVADFNPPDPAICQTLAERANQALNVETTVAETPFTNYIDGRSGTGCEIKATGTGADFTSFADAAAALRSTFLSMGWIEDQRFAADGPTGTGTAFFQNNILCLVSSGWRPASDDLCPSDQPISLCQLAPEQQLYTVTVTCAQSAAQQ